MNTDGHEGRREGDAWFATVSLAGLAATSLLAYAFLWLKPLWLGNFEPFAGDAVSLMRILGADWGGLAQYVIAAFVPFGCYVLALATLPHAPARFAWPLSIAFAAAAPLLLLYTYPAMAADVFDYLFSGRLMAEYDLNPYRYNAFSLPDDIYQPPVGWKDLRSVYGPAWVLPMGGIAAIAGDSPERGLLITKAIAILAHWVVAALVWALARRLAPERALVAFVAYAWNPLPILYFAIDGHNDAVMMALVLGALLLALSGRWLFALPVMAAAALVKFVPAVLIPVLLWKGRREPVALVAGTALSLVLTLALYAPLWAGTDTFEGVRDQASRSTSSLAALGSFVLPDGWLRPLAAGLFAGGFVTILRRDPPLITMAYAIMLLYLLVLSFWTKEWYFTWLVALGAVVGGAALWITIPGVLLLLTATMFGSWGWEMDWLGWQQRWGMPAIEAALTAATLGGWIVGLGVFAYRSRRGPRRRAPEPAGSLAQTARS